MREEPETLRQRVERIFQYEVTGDPLLLRLTVGAADPSESVSAEEMFGIFAQIVQALSVALFDLAEQLDARLGREL